MKQKMKALNFLLFNHIPTPALNRMDYFNWEKSDYEKSLKHISNNLIKKLIT